jgi:hypothetical protein
MKTLISINNLSSIKTDSRLSTLLPYFQQNKVIRLLNVVGLFSTKVKKPEIRFLYLKLAAKSRSSSKLPVVRANTKKTIT